MWKILIKVDPKTKTSKTKSGRAQKSHRRSLTKTKTNNVLTKPNSDAIGLPLSARGIGTHGID